jgi:peptidoglycan/LPS O-acetylase OafA/YrhL
LGSAFLDVVRFGAAFAVCYGHFSTPLFSTGWKVWMHLGGRAVAVFFVLSGFMMRLITKTREMKPRDYWVDRLSRIYSVLLPALLFTIIVNGIGRLYHRGHFPPGAFAGALPVALFSLTNLTFTSQWLGLNIDTPVNPVFWTLSYECSYYLLFGLIIFGRGRRNLIVFGLFCLLMGLPIMFLFPVWLSGCVAHDLYQRLREYRSAWLVYSVCLAVIAASIIAFHGAIRLAVSYLKAFSGIVWLRGVHQHLAAKNLHIFQRASPDFYFVGIPTAILMVWLLLLADRLQHLVPVRSLRWIRLIAEGTFTLYLTHLAIFVLFADLVPYPKGNLLVKCGALFLTVCLCIALSFPMEALKRKLRKVLHGRQHDVMEEVDISTVRPASPDFGS